MPRSMLPFAQVRGEFGDFLPICVQETAFFAQAFRCDAEMAGDDANHAFGEMGIEVISFMLLISKNMT